jgi:hypothetical protein
MAVLEGGNFNFTFLLQLFIQECIISCDHIYNYYLSINGKLIFTNLTGISEEMCPFHKMRYCAFNYLGCDMSNERE